MSQPVPMMNVAKALLVLFGMAFAAIYLIYRQQPNRLLFMKGLPVSKEKSTAEAVEVSEFAEPELDIRASADLDWSIIYRGGPAQRSRVAAAIKDAADIYKLDQNLIRSVIMAESMFETEAVSEKGAKGLMQLMPETAMQLGVKNPFDPRENILAGSLYLSAMLKQFEGNLSLALAAYHAGPQTVIDNDNKVPSSSRKYVVLVASYYELFGVDANKYSAGIYSIAPTVPENG